MLDIFILLLVVLILAPRLVLVFDSADFFSRANFSLYLYNDYVIINKINDNADDDDDDDDTLI